VRRLAVLLLVVAILGGCSGGAPSKDSDGNPIASGSDWSAGKKSASRSAVPKDLLFSDDVIKAFGKDALDKYKRCGVPPTVKPGDIKNAPPGFDPNSGLPPPHNDFPLEVSMTPQKGDPGTKLTIKAMAVGQPNSLIVVIARFFDAKHHGMRAARTTDVAGRATFEGPIPKDVPRGVAYIYVSASTKQSKSALTSKKFIVTGPGCR
jgi:hypothetical protein